LLRALDERFGISFRVVVLVKVVKTRMFGERHLDRGLLDDGRWLGQLADCAWCARPIWMEVKWLDKNGAR
jgi:hypothetical protein